MQTLDVILGRRSVRGFTSEPVSDEAMDTLLQAAAAAPSGGNLQAWAFISIRQSRRIAAVRALSPGIIGQPAALIAICADKRRVKGSHGELDDMLAYDIGAAMENILLAAHDMGLGACAIGSFDRRGLSLFLELPDFLELRLLVAIGTAKALPAAPRKRPLGEVCHDERYGGKK